MSQQRGERERFVLVAVSTAGGPAGLRVTVWRRLRSLGALYVQQSVCLLPAREAVRRQVSRLLARVRADGGTGRTLTVELADPAEYAGVVAEFNAARDVEYGEVIERVPAFLDEIATETARGRATYAEVEESEADLTRFRSWLAKIEARDWFGAPRGDSARAAVERCARALAEFEAMALRREAEPVVASGTDPATGSTVDPAADGAAPRLRVVDAAGSAPDEPDEPGGPRRPRRSR